MAYLGENIPKLGFGLMRLPMKDRMIDVEQTKEMADVFIDSGFTYFDTAYGYFEGKSEETAKAAVVDRFPRERFQLATKLPAWAGPKTTEDAKQMFWTSLERTGAGYFDFYLLHNLGSTRSKSFDDFGIWDYVQGLKQKGLIRHVGFSFHDKADLLDSILAAHPEMEFVQLQINYGDWESGMVQSRKCYEVARKHNKPIIIMEPVKGGMLANMAPEVRAVFDETGSKMSYASWAIRFAASLDGVITVLSGMSSLEQVRDNVGYMKDFRPLDENEKAVIAKAQKALSQIPSIPCTACEYCVAGCPEKIAIPQILEMLNRDLVYKSFESGKFGYFWETQFGGKASTCTQCGKCEEVCPQQIEIRDALKEAAAKYE
ncbi:MAG: aldo/keto reductase [Oscillospiraceae bacterium]|jgi:predicted aldo/keto reductase-like oxidoreductase|nr:aldo/keto reductase [Oscillospiraceae bacterium]